MDKKFLVMSTIFLLITVILSSCVKEKRESTKKIKLRFENWEVTSEQLSLWQGVTDKFNQSQSKI